MDVGILAAVARWNEEQAHRAHEESRSKHNSEEEREYYKRRAARLDQQVDRLWAQWEMA